MEENDVSDDVETTIVLEGNVGLERECWYYF